MMSTYRFILIFFVFNLIIGYCVTDYNTSNRDAYVQITSSSIDEKGNNLIDSAYKTGSSSNVQEALVEGDLQGMSGDFREILWNAGNVMSIDTGDSQLANVVDKIFAIIRSIVLVFAGIEIYYATWGKKVS